MNLIQKFAVAAAALTLSMVAASASAAIFIDFEDAAPGFLPTNYEGVFTWSGGGGPNSWVVGLESDDTFPGTEAHSQNHYTWSNGGTSLSISGGTFTFNTMWARVGYGGPGSAIAHGFVGSTELFTQALNLSDTYQLFTLNFTGIDSWTLTDQSSNTLIDDITLNNNVAAVPESTSLAIWGLSVSGAIGLALVKRHRAAAGNR